MPDRIQITFTANESKRLIAKAAHKLLQEQGRITNGSSVLLLGGTTVSALAEELGCKPLRISGRIDAGGTRTALNIGDGAHNLLLKNGQAINIDKNICKAVAELSENDIIVTGANAMDTRGRAALVFASLHGGSRGDALNEAKKRHLPMLILCGLDKLIPDIEAAAEAAVQSEIGTAMGAALELCTLEGNIITELEAFRILFDVQAFAIAGGGIGSGEGSRTFVLTGEQGLLMQAWDFALALKGSKLSADQDSLTPCHGGCTSCGRHTGCIYKLKAKKQ